MVFIIGAVDSAASKTYTVDMEENVMQVIDSFNGKTVLSFDPYGGMDYSRADFKNVDTYLQTYRK